jgi:diguanylate cyclase (GGDEF)-like protein
MHAGITNMLAASTPADRGRPMRILVAEDNPIFQSMLSGLLGKWGYEAVVARDGNEAWRQMQPACRPRMAVLDWMMPGMDGVEVCRRVRAAGLEPYTYIILLTARTDSQDLVDGMDAGADDYLTKPFHSHELRVRLHAGRRILELQEELLAAREALREQATHDALTHLLNRATVLDALHTELERAARTRKPLALLMADLDRFKHINDSLGHLAGDSVLRETAARMKAAVRGYDSIGRYGGEEFLIVLPGCDLDAGRDRAECLREAVSSAPYSVPTGQVAVSCSIGVSWRFQPLPPDAAALIREADRALYRAKERGRNRVETVHEDLPSCALINIHPGNDQSERT